METIGVIGVIQGLQGHILGLCGDNGKEHGNYRGDRGNIRVI